MTAQRIFDIAVIGGGPAGSSAAITAVRGGLNVLLLERGSFPRQKVCGEFVSGESLGLLRTLLGDHLLLREALEIPAARLFLDDRVIQTEISPPARSIPRFDLDAILWRAAITAGLTAQQKIAVTDIAGEGPFHITTSEGFFEARAVIDCSGRWSGLSAPLPSITNPKWIGIKAHYCALLSEVPPSVDLYFFRHGYCGVQPISATSINACAMVRADIATSLEEVFGCHPQLQERSRSWELLTEPVTTSPLHFRDLQPIAERILRAGDTAGFIDPFLGDGISLALHTGTMAAKSLSRVFRENQSLADAAATYATEYQRNIAPAFAHAARLRKLLDMPSPLRKTASGLLRIRSVSGWIFQNTRARIRAS